MSFPKLPSYRFSWRSIQMEPTPLSGERITTGVIVKGEDQDLVTVQLLSASHLGKIYGLEFGRRITDAMGLCVRHAKRFYAANPLSTAWSPPLERFFLSDIHSSVAESMEESVSRAAVRCSSLSASEEIEKMAALRQSRISAPESWRRRVTQAVTAEHAEFGGCFQKSIMMAGSVSLNFGFMSDRYAAQFDAVGGMKTIRRSLSRVYGKLWQLDRLREEVSLLFRPEAYELLLEKPVANDAREESALNEFLEELRVEASRREIGLYATESPVDAARHLIEKALSGDTPGTSPREPTVQAGG